MDTTIIILCVALVLVAGAALVCEAIRMRRGYRELSEERAKDEKEPPQLVVVRQDKGNVHIAYFVAENEETSAEESAEAENSAAGETAADAAPEQESEGAERLMAVPEGGVVLARSEKQTFAEKYAELDEEKRAFLDEFTAHVTGKENCVKVLQTSALSFKYKKSLIVKAVIRRDTVSLNFSIANPELGRMMREGKTKSIRMQPVQIRLLSASDVNLAKQTADMTVGYLQSEEEYRLEKRREARREAERLRRAEAAAASDPEQEGVQS